MAEVPRTTWAEVSARRLRRHALDFPEPSAGPASIAATICGAHAQVLSAAKLSIGLRLPGATRVDVREALWTERSLIKTRGPRGTVHLLASADLPMWTGALSLFRLSGITCGPSVPPEEPHPSLFVEVDARMRASTSTNSDQGPMGP